MIHCTLCGKVGVVITDELCPVSKALLGKHDWAKLKLSDDPEVTPDITECVHGIFAPFCTLCNPEPARDG